MRLLFDQNLSPRLVERLEDIYPRSSHVQLLGLDHAEDKVVWDNAQQEDYCIVTKDADFHERSILFGFPPKVIWICRGNCSTLQIEAILRENYTLIQGLETDGNLGVLILF